MVEVPDTTVKIAYEHMTVPKKHAMLLGVIADMMGTRQTIAIQKIIEEAYNKLAKKEDPHRLDHFLTRVDTMYPIKRDQLIPTIDSDGVIEQLQQERQMRDDETEKIKSRARQTAVDPTKDPKRAAFEEKAAAEEQKKK